MASQRKSSGNVWKFAVIIGSLAAAVGVWHWSSSDERATQQDAVQAVSGIVYVVKCSACENEFEMPAPEYVEKLKPEGVECPKCGKRAARMIRTSEEVDREVFREEANTYTTVAAIKAAAESNLRELDAARAELEAAEAAGDAAKATELRKKKNTLMAKDQALNYRWSELQAAP